MFNSLQCTGRTPAPQSMIRPEVPRLSNGRCPPVPALLLLVRQTVTEPPLGPCRGQEAQQRAFRPPARPQQLSQLGTSHGTVMDVAEALRGERGRCSPTSLPTPGQGFLGSEQSW